MKKYKFKIHATVSMTSESIFDHLIGSGASCYPWWRTVDLTDEGFLLLEADSETDIDGVEPPVSKTLTIDEVVAGIQAMLDDPKCPESVTWGFQHDDIDSDAADVILQTLLFGQPIFA